MEIGTGVMSIVIGTLFISQRLDRLQAGGPPGRIDTKDEANGCGEACSQQRNGGVDHEFGAQRPGGYTCHE